MIEVLRRRASVPTPYLYVSRPHEAIQKVVSVFASLFRLRQRVLAQEVSIVLFKPPHVDRTDNGAASVRVRLSSLNGGDQVVPDAQQDAEFEFEGSDSGGVTRIVEF
jgi:hypothetical protein